MPQKKEKKKVIKKVTKTVIKNGKIQPLLKNSINIKIDLDDDNEKKKKPKRKKRQQKQADETANNEAASYVDEVGRPISNEIINKSFNRSYMPQPFSRNSTVIGTSFNESAIMDRVTEKLSKLNTSNQSMNQSMNQSGIAPPQLPRPARTTALSTIAPASPSIAATIAPQSLNFDLTSRAGLSPMQASSMVMNNVQQYAMSSMRSAMNLQAALARIFKGVSDIDQAEIKQTVHEIRDDVDAIADIRSGKNGGAQAMKLKRAFKLIYTGSMIAKEAATIAWQYYQLID
jgi:hypothetical protein